jgi:hypothetical protein
LALSHLAGMAARAQVALIRSRETPKRPTASPSMGLLTLFRGAIHQRRQTHHPCWVPDHDQALSINQAGRARRLKPTALSSSSPQFRDRRSC